MFRLKYFLEALCTSILHYTVYAKNKYKSTLTELISSSKHSLILSITASVNTGEIELSSVNSKRSTTKLAGTYNKI